MGKFEERLGRIKEVTLTRPYVYYFILIFLVYLIINIIVNKVYITAPTLLTNNLKIIIPYLIFTIFIAFLVALNINLTVKKFKDLRKVKKESGLTFIGIFGGVLGGACPSCFVGLFPAFLGLFGITATLSSLPFFGIEILVGSVIFLVIGMVLLTRDNVCKIKK
ncbi:hypothetical protein HYV88_00925 [Candidatus Woesearchaeota archaeon]|nr:hypothetical protein [Candidatus Woesearchaeota archaeon]